MGGYTAPADSQMGSSQSTRPGTPAGPAGLGARAGQYAAAANQGAMNAASGLHAAAQTTAALTQGAAALAQAADPAINALKLAMANIQRTRGVTGGGPPGYFGGDDTADPAKGLREYEASFSAAAKSDVIRRLARALKRAGVAVDPEADPDVIVKQLVEKIPSPRNGKTFPADAKVQEAVCRAVADVLNDEFSPGETRASHKFIDTSLGAVEMCRAVGEWAHSFAAGVNTEFLAVHASVKTVLQRISILDQIMSELYAKIRGRVASSGDDALGRDVDPLDEVYTRAQNERRRQEAVLQNILKVQLAPAAKELEIAMRDESEQNALIKRLGLRPGTSEFSDQLAMAISSLGTAAAVAQRVHKALKQVGLSVRQYLDSAEYADFRRELDRAVESGSVKPADLAKFLEAAETLRLSFGERAEPRFREALEEADRGATGGADEPSPIGKKLEREGVERKIIIRDFAGRMSRHYDELLAAMKSLAPLLGKEIPISDKTDALRDAMTRVRDLRGESQRLELALIGRYIDAEARERKERFVSALRVVAAACGSLLELTAYRGAAPQFSRLKAAIEAIEKTIDYFADVITKKYGGADVPADEHAEDAADMYEGGGRGTRGGADPADSVLPEVARSALSLGEAIDEFEYFYYIAGVRANLAHTAKELDSYGEDYVARLGDAVAGRLYTLEQERAAILRQLAGGGLPAWLTGDANKAALDAAKRWVNDEYDIKARFYRVVQGVDLYLKAFTAAIVKDPDAVRDIKKMLDGTQTIARWYSEQTGDHIWRAFEHMRAYDFTNDTPTDAGAGAAALAVQGADHYYARLALYAGPAPADTLGVPEFGVRPSGGAADPAAAAKKEVGEALDFFQALKNLVNAFARIGDRFGGRELRAQVFMSPTQMYKNLHDYMKQSALSINAGNGAAPPANLQSPAFGPATQAVGNAAPPYSVYFGAVPEPGSGVVGNYTVENRYFAMIIKAMAAKILTTLGVYEMFERTTPLAELTPTRMIIGGARGGDEAEPAVLEGAAELYFRLPRLAEFYRGLLRWDGSAGDKVVDNMRIAMLPELEGVFSGLIRLVFQKAVAPETGDYSESELRAMVTEVNRVYEYFQAKHSGQATKEALTAFVAEVNRRYGIIKQKDMQDYWSLANLARTGRPPAADTNDTNYAILPDEGESEVDRRAPSDNYAVGTGVRYDPATGRPLNPETGAAYEPFAGRAGLDLSGKGAQRMLRDFRTQLDALFAQGRPGARPGSSSYALLIQQAETEIRRSAAPDAKLQVAYRLIQGTSVAGTDADKSLMFHETVVLGLNALCAIESMLRLFSAAVDQMNPLDLENAIMDSIYMNVTGSSLDPAGQRAGLATAAYADLAATIEGRHKPFATKAPGFARYISAVNFAGRSGAAPDVGAAAVIQFIAAEGAGYLAGRGGTSLGANYLPSSFAHSAALTAADGTTLDAAVGGTAAQNQATARYVRALRLTARAMTNYGLIMQEFVENVFDISTAAQGLVELRFTAGAQPGVQLGFSKLRGVAEGLLADVKQYFELFRPSMPKATLDRYEDREKPGSIFWLEDHLVDQIFRGTDDRSPATLEGISRRANAVLQGLVRETNVRFSVLTAAGLADANPAVRLTMMPDPTPGDESRFEWYGQAFSRLAFYNSTGLDESSATGIGNAAAFSDNNYSLDSSVLTEDRAGAVPATAAGAAGRFPVYGSEGTMTPHRSLLFAFNQLVARYLSTLTDIGGGRRIYINLINAYANGSAGQAVTLPGGNTHPDVANPGEPFGMRGDPKPGAILFQSLAWILQRFVKDVNANNQVPKHLVATLTDVPLYMKEGYRANLPGFVKLFDLLSQKGDFIKQLVQKVPTINLTRPSQQVLATAAIGAPGAGVVPKIRIAGGYRADGNASYPANALAALEPLSGKLSGDEMRSRLVAVVDAVMDGAYTLSNAASEVLKEIGDMPAFFQTQEGSIETYKQRYGDMPLMPLSLSLWFLSDIPQAAAAAPVGNLVVTDTATYNDERLFPRHTLGTPGFRVAYGHRQLLARDTPVGFEQMPGVRALLAAYNGVNAKREQLDESQYLRFAQNVVAALRFVTVARNYKSALTTSSSLFSAASLIGGANGLANYDKGRNQGVAAYAVAAPAVDAQVVLSVVENSNRAEEAGKISARVGAAAAAVGAASGRQTEWIYNLVDMNIVPINVHALMRSSPLANLYNYEFTFEQMAASVFGEQSAQYTKAGGLTDAETKSTRQMHLRLLVDPFTPVSAAMYGSDALDLGSAGFVQRIFRGDNNLGMARPKFLSDQVFNKALFGSVYQSPDDYDEGGPSVGIGAARGYGAVAGPVQATLQELQNISMAMERECLALQQIAGGNDINGASADVKGAVYDYLRTTGRSAVSSWVDRVNGLQLQWPDQNTAPGQQIATFARMLTGGGGLVPNISAVMGRDRGAAIVHAGYVALVNQIIQVLDAARAAVDVLLSNRGAGWVPLRRQLVDEALAQPRRPGLTPAGQWTAQRGRRGAELTYLKPSASAGDPPESAVVGVSLGGLSKLHLQDIGKARFDTTFVRSLIFPTLVVRTVRLKLHRELTQSRNVLVASHEAVAPGVTEFGLDPFSPNEVLGSRLPNGLPRFNDLSM